jgi:predicted secreted protein
MAENENNNNTSEPEILEGNDLILGINGTALGHSDNCKVSTSVETKTRQTKEATNGLFKEKYVSSISETITADGLVAKDPDSERPTYAELKALQLAGKPIEAQYSVRDGQTRNFKTAAGYKGMYVITSLEITGQSGEDAKYSVTLENSGEIKAVSEDGSLS